MEKGSEQQQQNNDAPKKGGGRTKGGGAGKRKEPPPVNVWEYFEKTTGDQVSCRKCPFTAEYKDDAPTITLERHIRKQHIDAKAAKKANQTQNQNQNQKVQNQPKSTTSENNSTKSNNNNNNNKNQTTNTTTTSSEEASSSAVAEATIPKVQGDDDEDQGLKAGGRPQKNPKGMRDYSPLQVKIREQVISTIASCFKRHGATTIDTPVMELTQALQGNYGEGNKEIFNISNSNDPESIKESISLRYDLTVPFARYCAANGLEKFKRYHIAKVYRKDTPRMTRGRYREFYQCDYDIAGVYDSMIPDAECVKILTEILDALQIGNFVIKINHRKILDAVFELAGVSKENFATIASAVDKLDKVEWQVVADEMKDKGLSEQAVSKIGEIVLIKGEPYKVLAQLKALTWGADSPAKAAFADMDTLFEYLKALKVFNRITFDLSMVRGLGYYTGMILEAVLLDNTTEGGIGSIAGGGRYDHLVDAFGVKDVPAVGFSVGIERIFSLMEDRCVGQRDNETEVMVASIGTGMFERKLEVCEELWREKINAEFLYAKDPRIGVQLDYANKKGIPFAVIFGEDEIKNNKLKIKNMNAEIDAQGQEQGGATKRKDPEEVIDRDQLIPRLRQLLNKQK